MMSADNVSPLTPSDLLVVLIIGLAIFLGLRAIPVLSTLVERFFTMVHELGHVVATMITGGESKGYRVYYNPKSDELGTRYGEATREGGDPLLVNPAGYLASALLSAGLILLSGHTNIAAYVLFALGLMILLLSLTLGRSCFTILLGLIFGVGFISVAWKAKPAWSVFLLVTIALASGFTALAGIRELEGVIRNPANKKTDDASQMADLFSRWPILRSPMFWVRAWLLLAVLLIGGAFWFTWLRARPG